MDLATAITAPMLPALPPRPALPLLPVHATAPTREAWLQRLVEGLRPRFERAAGVKLASRIRVSCSWASSRRAIGECWDPRASQDGTWEIMISYRHATPMASAETLVHELVHVAVGIQAKHGKVFKRCAEAVGLRGPMRYTPDMTDGLRRCLHALCRSAGEYPGAPLGLGIRKSGTPLPGAGGAAGGATGGAGTDPLSSGPAVQVARQMLVWCDRCGVKLRGSRGLGPDGGGIRSLMPSPSTPWACPCGGKYVPEHPLAIWPEGLYLARALSWLAYMEV